MLQLIQSGGLTLACIIAKPSKGSNVCGEKVAVAIGEQAYLWRAEGASVKQAEKALSSVGRSVGVGPISPTRQHAFVRNSDFGCKKRRRGIGHLVLQSHSLSCRAVDNPAMMEREVCGEL